MNSKGFWLFASTLLLACAAEQEAAVDEFKDDIVKASEKVKEFGEHISKMLGLDNLPKGNEIVDIIKTQAKTFSDHAEQIQKQLELEVQRLSNTTLAESFNDFNKKVHTVVSDFRTKIENSGASERAAELQGKFQEGITGLVEETKKIALALEPQVMGVGSELQKLTKKVMSDAVSSLDELQGKIHTATGHEESAGHKHDP